MAAEKVTPLRPNGQSNGKQDEEGGYDPWQLDTGASYSREKRYTRSVNKHDHSVNIQVPVPRDVAAKISELVQKGVIPEFRSSQDFIRDSVIHNLHYWCEDQGIMDAQGVVNAEMQLSMIAQQRQRVATWRGLVEEARLLVTELIQDQNKEELRVQCENLNEIADTIPNPYQAQVKALVALHLSGE